MKPRRIYVEKRSGFDTGAESLRGELNSNLGLDIRRLRLISVYDLFGFDDGLLEKCSYKVFAEPATDTFSEVAPEAPDAPYVAIENLPGQFDQRASSAEACVKLLQPDAEIVIRSGKLLLFDEDVRPDDIEKIKAYCINPVESRFKDLSSLVLPENAAPRPETVLEGFTDIKPGDASAYCEANGLAMNGDDLMMVVEYFQKEGRDPNRTELKILDTYWSDHCRHTTFTTELTDIKVAPSKYSADIERTLRDWKGIRRLLGREEKPLCLMDLATIGARYLIHTGELDNLEQSEENNACSVFVEIDLDGKPEKWLMQFKNETHNHPTEIEPFGGASTCIGGAVRDPLSGRAYVYQAMRVTGAGDIYAPIEATLPGKLPQRVISLRAAAGYSSYGNQLGLATTHVREIYHPGYAAKRLEVGAVVGAVKADQVRREKPAPGDVILMLGGRTGRDGIGGATGSSKQHTESSLEECGSEVQKGNAPEERKLQRLFRRPEVTRMIKKSNDFGAGGVSVAIGELADGLDIYLDRIKTKYTGLSSTDLAISESQERMAVVVSPEDKARFEEYCAEENLEVTHVADVTDSGRMRMYMGKEMIADLSREFIDSAGARHRASALIGAPESVDSYLNLQWPVQIGEGMKAVLSDPNVTSQKGLAEMFDSSIGAGTVLMPFGGKTQRSEVQVSVQRFPTGNRHTDTASLMAYGYNPYLTEWSPYHGAAYAVVEATAKAVAAGADFSKLRFSYQEYFERMNSPEAWGKPLAALLGALRIQIEMGLPSIGGKDSMSGTFDKINVPPTLIAFGVAPVDGRHVVSSDLKAPFHKLYLLKVKSTETGMPDTEWLKKAYADYHQRVKAGAIESAYAVGFGGVAEAIAKMSFGNRVGANICLANVNHEDVSAGVTEQMETRPEQLFRWRYGSILIESNQELPEDIYMHIGETTDEPEIRIDWHTFPIEQLYEWNRSRFASVYPDRTEGGRELDKIETITDASIGKPEKADHPLVYLPVFPGTNCDYDMADAFEREGAEVKFGVFRNLTAEDINKSIDELADNIDRCQILALSGGFSAGDEPDGSGKFIAGVLMNAKVKKAIEGLLARKGLILGICNGFQALVKSGLLPYGKIGELSSESPTLTRNDINRHISQMVSTVVASVASPWLDGFKVGELFTVAASHGEGKFMASPEIAEELLAHEQVAFQYANPATGNPTMESPYNPNGSTLAIEGIISPDGLILGKMAHSERYRDGLMKNIPGNKNQNIFKNAVKYFKNGKERNDL